MLEKFILVFALVCQPSARQRHSTPLALLPDNAQPGDLNRCTPEGTVCFSGINFHRGLSLDAAVACFIRHVERRAPHLLCPCRSALPLLVGLCRKSSWLPHYLCKVNQNNQFQQYTGDLSLRK